MLCNSLPRNDGVLSPDSTIKYNAAKSVLVLQIGTKIKLIVDGCSGPA
jgi:hypothetical protein